MTISHVVMITYDDDEDDDDDDNKFVSFQLSFKMQIIKFFVQLHIKIKRIPCVCFVLQN